MHVDRDFSISSRIAFHIYASLCIRNLIHLDTFSGSDHVETHLSNYNRIIRVFL